LLVLWDIISDSEIKVLHALSYDFGGGPKWNKLGTNFYISLPPSVTTWKGSKFINDDAPYNYSGGDEIYQISDEGNLTRLSFFTTRYQAAEEGLSLSPDEKSIAFWLNMNYSFRDRNPQTELVILNLLTNKFTSLCIKGGDYPLTPVWSPQSDYLIASISDYSSDKTTSYIVNLNNYDAYPLKENGYVYGWLNNSDK
jgi:hypothetical protein